MRAGLFAVGALMMAACNTDGYIVRRQDDGAVELPIEVLGPPGTTETRTLVLGVGGADRAVTLRVRVHGLRDGVRASLRVNGGTWVPIANDTVAVDEPARQYGGIGGGPATVSFSYPLAAGSIADGPNEIAFRFDGAPRLSVGFRVLELNLVDRVGAPLVGADSFRLSDPRAWRPASADRATLERGRVLWESAPLVQRIAGVLRPIAAHCGDCHARDGRDLKFFGYSNRSIHAFAKLFGLDDAESLLVANYIRSLPVPTAGRPWNPPYQPGPGLDHGNWAAGAGLEAVFTRDADALAAAFPEGFDGSALSTKGTLNLRELGVSLQLPDWNQWLPPIHPKDTLETSDAAALEQLYQRLRGQLAASTLDAHALPGAFDAWGHASAHAKLFDARPNPSSREDMSVREATKWRLVKTWELMQEFRLEERGLEVYGAGAEPRTWLGRAAFAAWESPYALGLPWTDALAAGGSRVAHTYIDVAWLHLGLVLNPGNRRHSCHAPIDWLAYKNISENLAALSGVAEPARLVYATVKGLQEIDNGIGPEDPCRGWTLFGPGDLSYLVRPGADAVWGSALSVEQRRSITQHIVRAWWRTHGSFPVEAFTRADPMNGWSLGSRDATLRPGHYDGTAGERFFNAALRYKALAITPELWAPMADWGRMVLPSGDWDALR